MNTWALSQFPSFPPYPDFPQPLVTIILKEFDDGEAGVDIGAKTIKIVVLQEDTIIEKTLVMAGYDFQGSLKTAWDEVLTKTGLRLNQIDRIVATGTGKKGAGMAHDRISDVSAARGATALDNRVRTVIDVGAEEGRAIKIDANGKVMDFAINEKCAAGTGAFAEARAVHDAIAGRIVSMVRRVGPDKEIMLIGGLAKNVGFYESLKRELETEVIVPKDPEYVSALGAALLAAGI